jgi:hypothetical protein
MIFKIFLPNKFAKKCHQTMFLQKFVQNIGFKKNGIFSPKIGKNRRKL